MSDLPRLDLAAFSPASRWLLRRVPALDSLRNYRRSDFIRDLTAGITVATVAVPQAMAYALLAGLPPQYGLYTAIVMTAVGALLDSSRQLINGPTNAISIALLSALVFIPEADRIPAAIAMAFLVGAIQLSIAFLKLGDLTRFVSHSVIVGFTLGASTLLILDQTKHLFGLTARGEPHDHFLTRFWLTIASGSVHLPTLAVGVGTIVLVVSIRRFNKSLQRRGFRFPIPQHLVAVSLMALLVWACALHERGVAIVGEVPSSLPAFQFPELKWDQTRQLMGSAFAIAVLGLLEAIAMAKAIAARTRQKLDINQQCLSEGAANLAGSFFQCFPGSGSLTRSAVNQQAGAVSQWSGVFAALTVAATVVALAPLASFIPRASLAGLLILAAYRMIDGRQLLFHLRATRFDFGVVLVTALAAVLISIEFCIVIGVFMSFVLYVPKAAQVKLHPLVITPEGELREKLPHDTVHKRVVCYELDGELFFGAEVDFAKHLEAIRDAATGDVRVVLLVLRRGRNADAAFLAQLREFHAVLQARGIAVILSGVPPELRAALANTGLLSLLGADRVFTDSQGDRATDTPAVEHAFRLLAELLENTSPCAPATAARPVVDPDALLRDQVENSPYCSSTPQGSLR
ncbi:MAG: SulP family inorganic anion transporter [Gemmataceae bacterium]|nr:SulP family inorganic anion transporter [Gemmata sp.]MDW8198609.1 SulP family inorganic anion transporter [Gemmataceae bacterium]